MTIEDIERVVLAAAKERMPSLDKNEALSLQIETMQDYLLKTAQARGELEEARLHAHMALYVLKDDWDDMQGWELHLENGKRTLAAVERAKALTRPELREGMRKARHLIDRLTDQIKRLEIDDKAASRIYTMLTGG